MLRLSWWSYPFHRPGHLPESTFTLARRDPVGFHRLTRSGLRTQLGELFIAYRPHLAAATAGVVVLQFLPENPAGWRFLLAAVAALIAFLFPLSFAASLLAFGIYAFRSVDYARQVAASARAASTYAEFLTSATIRGLIAAPDDA